MYGCCLHRWSSCEFDVDWSCCWILYFSISKSTPTWTFFFRAQKDRYKATLYTYSTLSDIRFDACITRCISIGRSCILRLARALSLHRGLWREIMSQLACLLPTAQKLGVIFRVSPWLASDNHFSVLVVDASSVRHDMCLWLEALLKFCYDTST